MTIVAPASSATRERIPSAPTQDARTRWTPATAGTEPHADNVAAIGKQSHQRALFRELYARSERGVKKYLVQDLAPRSIG